jgi:hypothetical protein
MRKIILAIVSILFIPIITTAQYKSTRINNDSKFYFKKSNIHFATYEEMIINDSVTSGLIIKDIRGQLIATVLYKIGKEIADTLQPYYTIKPYTEIYFTKNILACQLQSIVCKDDLKNILENLLYDDQSTVLPKSFTYIYEIDYNKVDVFCENNAILFTDLTEEVYNPINDYSRLLRYSSENNTCNKKNTVKNNQKKQSIKKN